MLPVIRVNEIASVRRLVHHTGSSYRRNWQSYALTIKKIGRTVYETNSGTYVTDRSHMLLIRKGLSCIIHPEIGECVTVEFEGSFSNNLPEVTSLDLSTVFGSIDILDSMEKKWAIKDSTCQYSCLADFYRILSILEQEAYPVDVVSHGSQIQPAINFINQNYGDPELCNEDLARCVNLSVSRFRQVFRDALNISPMQYLRTVRINKAKKLLAELNKSITEISEISGFSSPFYFDVVFKKETGMTPMGFIRSIK